MAKPSIAPSVAKTAGEVPSTLPTTDSSELPAVASETSAA